MTFIRDERTHGIINTNDSEYNNLLNARNLRKELLKMQSSVEDMKKVLSEVEELKALVKEITGIKLNG